MNQFKYRVYYEYRPPNQADPSPRSPMSPSEIEDAFRLFESDLSHRISDLDARIFTDYSELSKGQVLVRIETTDSEASVDEAVTKTLKSLRLLGEKTKAD